MTAAIASLVALGTLAAALPRWVRAWRVLVGTTLLVPWTWGCSAWGVWTASAACDALVLGGGRNLVAAATRDRLGYGAALLTLASLVAVLGARRPTDRVWSVFVLLPLLLVLGLPALTAAGVFGPATPLRLETPLLLGYALVVAMGAGNYFGTCFTLPCLLGAAGLLLLGVRQAGLLADLLPPEVARSLAATLVAGAVLVARRARVDGSRGEDRGAQTGDDEAPLPRFDRLWADVRDLFGLVWAKRLMDRVNATAARHAWPVRLELDGFVPLDPAHGGAVDAARLEADVEHTLRWLLRRFADAEWIDARLPGASAPPQSAVPS